jgi:hypothetical protein
VLVRLVAAGQVAADRRVRVALARLTIGDRRQALVLPSDGTFSDARSHGSSFVRLEVRATVGQPHLW